MLQTEKDKEMGYSEDYLRDEYNKQQEFLAKELPPLVEAHNSNCMELNREYAMKRSPEWREKDAQRMLKEIREWKEGFREFDKQWCMKHNRVDLHNNLYAE